MVHRRPSDRGLGIRPGRSRPPAEAGLRRGARALPGPLPPPLPRYPRVSVVVCAYNAERTMEAVPRLARSTSTIPITRSSSSTTARRTAPSRSPSASPIAGSSARRTRGCRVARNVGAEAATGEIVAYTDSDCVADPDWLTYLVAQDGGRRSRRLRRPEFPAARRQPGAGRGRGVAGRADACADQRRGGRAHRRLQHGVPPRRAAGAGRLRPDLSRRRRRCRHLLAVPGCRLHDRLQPRRGGLAFPPQHGARLHQPAARLRQGRGAGLCQASVPLQPVRPGEMARPHLRRSVGGAAVVAQAGDLFRRRSGAACSRRCTSRRLR